MISHSSRRNKDWRYPASNRQTLTGETRGSTCYDHVRETERADTEIFALILEKVNCKLFFYRLNAWSAGSSILRMTAA